MHQLPWMGNIVTDSLRTRIAAVADRIIREGIHVDLPTSVMADDLADAVIRELEADVMADDYVPPCCRPGGRCNR